MGLDEEVRRSIIADEANGKRSAKDLTAEEAGRVLDRLRASAPAAGGAAAGLDGPYAGKLRALWLSGWNLGVVRDRTDKALIHFVERQTGLSHPRFLRDPGDAAKAIEGIKGLLAREGGVKWPPAKAPLPKIKRAVLEAQWMRLIAIGAVKPFAPADPLADLDQYAFKVTWKNDWRHFDGAEFDQVQEALGRKLRAALMRAPARTDSKSA
jgi:uncharacterized protein DUF1018